MEIETRKSEAKNTKIVNTINRWMSVDENVISILHNMEVKFMRNRRQITEKKREKHRA